MRASSRLRALHLDISRDGADCLKSRFLGSVASFSTSSSSGGGSDDGGTPLAKPGSAEDLLNFLKIHRKEWKYKPGYEKRYQRYPKAAAEHPSTTSFSSKQYSRRDHRDNHLQPPKPFPASSSPYQHNRQQKYQQWKQQQAYQQPKSAAALGLSQSRRSREITSRVVAAFANADAQLRSNDLSKEDKLSAARRCILSFTRLSSFPLSDINISAMMHRVCRLVTHRGLGECRTSGGSAAGAAGYPNLDHVPLMEGLLDDVIARAKLEVLLTQPTPTTTTASAPTASLPLPPLMNDDKVHDSTAALALYSCGTIGMHLPQHDIDTLASILLTFQSMWTEKRIVMVLLALSRLGVTYNKLPEKSPTAALLDAIYTTSEERISKFSAEELSTLVWGFASVDYQNLQHDFLTKVMAALGLKVDELPIVGVFSTLEGLMMHEWIPPSPRSAWMEVNTTVNFSENSISGSGESGGGNGGGDLFYSSSSSRQILHDGTANEGSFQVRDLRELQSLAKEWEQQRRTGLAELLRGQQQHGGGGSSGGGGGGGISAFINSQQQQQQHSSNDTHKDGGLSLDALAQSAMRARAERTSKAQLLDVAAKIARELRASVATAGNDTDVDASTTSFSSFGEVVLHPSEDDDALVARLLTGEWEERKKTVQDQSRGSGGVSTSTTTTRILTKNENQPIKEATFAPEQTEQQQSNTTRGRGRRIFRLGPLLAEASINPSSGRETIQPHYERAHLWDPQLLHPSQQHQIDADGELVQLEDSNEKFENLESHHQIGASESHLENSEILSIGSTIDELPDEDNFSIDSTSTDTISSTPDELSEAAAAAITALAQRVTLMIPDSRPDQAVSFVRYFAALRHYDRDLLIAVRDKIEDMLKNYHPEVLDCDNSGGGSGSGGNNNSGNSTLPIRSTYLADFLWSFASLGITDLISPELSRKAIHAALHDRENSAVTLSRAAWSLAVLGHLDAPTLKQICARIVSNHTVSSNYTVSSNQSGARDGGERKEGRKEESEGVEKINTDVTNRVVLKQLFQAALQVEISTGESHTTLLPAELRNTAAAAWNDRRNYLSTSYLQRQVAGVLEKNMGLECELEHAPEGSFVVIDIAVFTQNTNKDKINDTTTTTTSVGKVAVEVDGPYHFATNKLNHKLGAMQLRDSLLRHSGWEVVSIPYYEWTQVKYRDRAKYLEGKVMSVF